MGSTIISTFQQCSRSTRFWPFGFFASPEMQWRKQRKFVFVPHIYPFATVNWQSSGFTTRMEDSRPRLCEFAQKKPPSASADRNADLPTVVSNQRILARNGDHPIPVHKRCYHPWPLAFLFA